MRSTEENRPAPTGWQLRVFGALWLLLFVALGLAAGRRPQGLLGGAAFLGTAWIASMLFNPAPRRRQLPGVVIPALLACIGGAVRAGASASRVGLATAAVGLVGALLVWAAPQLGQRLFIGWRDAALPLGWTISHVVLALVYYLVVTPVGLALRLFGHDAMKKKLDRSARSYWIERRSVTDKARAFRQF